MLNTKVKDLMTHDVFMVEEDDSVRSVIEIMSSKKSSSILVMESNNNSIVESDFSEGDLSEGDIVGIITERDIVRSLLDSEKESLLSLPASSIMSTSVVTVNENESLFDALVINQAHNIRHLPVLNSTLTPVGMLTQSDLVKAHFSTIEHDAQLIESIVRERTKELSDINSCLRTLALEDQLMGIGNRRAMDVDLMHNHSAAERYCYDYSIVMFDIDFFKLYNDHYGHLKGDWLLKEVAKILEQSARDADRLYRYGGEEILLLMPRTNLTEAKTLAERIVGKVAAEKIEHSAASGGVLTISAGVASFDPSSTDKVEWENVVDMADNALYRAKESGRNRVSL